MLAITTPDDGVNDEDTQMWPIGKHDLFFVTSTYNMMCNYTYTDDYYSSWNKSQYSRACEVLCATA